MEAEEGQGGDGKQEREAAEDDDVEGCGEDMEGCGNREDEDGGDGIGQRVGGDEVAEDEHGRTRGEEERRRGREMMGWYREEGVASHRVRERGGWRRKKKRLSFGVKLVFASNNIVEAL
ncbi:hypothetical protein CRG98_004543 [Punica granatum]|uniref:Uncharacterized protein n=1 Tax=Punica granatum TaxID=22663 RepID=A0A2I0L2Y3_PUNGR|nr:hypothetical protein CRG98_004543 [Punica granatum]